MFTDQEKTNIIENVGTLAQANYRQSDQEYMRCDACMYYARDSRNVLGCSRYQYLVDPQKVCNYFQGQMM